MSKVEIYVTRSCSYCVRAKALLKEKGVGWEEIDVTQDMERRVEMVERSGGRMTVPQIFIGDRHIGGYDDLAALERKGELDPLLAA